MSGWKSFSLCVAAFDCISGAMWFYGIYFSDLGVLPARAVASQADAGTIVTMTAFLVLNAIAALRLTSLEEQP